MAFPSVRAAVFHISMPQENHPTISQYTVSGTYHTGTITGSTLLKKNALIASLLVIDKTSFRSSIIQDAGSYAQRLSEKIIQVHAAAVVSVPLERPAAHPHSA